MNHDEAARKMATDVLDILLCGDPTNRFVDLRHYFTAELKELGAFPKVPEEIRVIKTKEHHDAAMAYVDEHMDDDDNPYLAVVVGLIEDYERRLTALTRCGNCGESPDDYDPNDRPVCELCGITGCDFCVPRTDDDHYVCWKCIKKRSPEVPVDLEAAMRHLMRSTLNFLLPNATAIIEEEDRKKHYALKDEYDKKEDYYVNAITAAVTPLLADKDKRLEIQHDTIFRLNERVKELELLKTKIGHSREHPF